MANSDYTVKGSAAFCQSARLVAAITPLQETFEITAFKVLDIAQPKAGEPALINNEIVSVVSFSPTMITVKRGCADTIPQSHALDSRIWFFQSSTGTDGQEHGATETMSVKVLPKTTSTRVPVEGSPPKEIAFNFRFARPYPPGNVKINGVTFDQTSTVNRNNQTMNVTWAHRDRVLQSDQMIGHTEGSVGPEVGTTYTVKIHTQNGAVVETISGLTLPSWSYTRAEFLSQYGVAMSQNGSPVNGYITLESERDGFTSLQQYRHNFTLVTKLESQIDTLTFSGTVVPSQNVRILAGGTLFTYTTIAGDTLSSVANSISNLINANVNYDALSNSNVVTMSGLGGVAYDVTTEIIDQATLVNSSVTNTSTANATTAQVSEFDFDRPIVSGLVLSVTVNGTKATYVVSGSDTATSALQALRNTLNASVGPVVASVSGANIVLTGVVNTPFTVSASSYVQSQLSVARVLTRTAE
jgi:hypothetical protein